MEKIDLSTNSRKIQDAYNKTVKGDASTTFVVYSVKDSVLDVTATGDGSLDEFVENFDDGKIQFGLSRVTVPGSDVSKILLLGWCPDNAPSKSRLSFASNFAEVSRVLSGYHVQITARDQDDLDVAEFLNRVGAAAGARYSVQSGQKAAPPKPKPTTVKPTPASSSSASSFVPKSTGKPVAPSSFVPKSTGKPVVPITPKPVLPKPTPAASKDEWGGEDEIEERDFSEKPLENVPSAYKPTKVNIDELRKQKSDTISSQPKPFKAPEAKEEVPEATPLADRLKPFKSNEEPSDGRLTSLPKAKVNHSVASRYNPVETSSDGPSFGSKPTFGAAPTKKEVVGGMSRNFANQGGKTPAQLWAEKRGQYKSVAADSDEPVKSTPAESNELASKFNQLNIGHKEEEEEQEEEEAEEQPEPASIKPSSFPPPPARAAEPEPEEEEEEEEEPAPTPAPVPAPAPAASLPARSLPPPPVRQVPAAAPVSAPEEEEEEEEEEPAPAAATPAKAESSTKPSAIAEYDYEKDEDNEIGFAEGDLIIDIEFVDEDWWSGKHAQTGEVGLFPSTYVTIKETSADSAPATAPSSEPAPAPAATAGKTATAEYDYEKDEDNEIAFAEGDVIVDIEFVDEDWWSGKHSKTGEVGLFPANYVKLN